MSCQFRNKIQQYKNKYKENTDAPKTIVENPTDNLPETCSTRSATKSVKSLEKKCFICNIVRVCNSNSYREGGLARVETDNTAGKIIERKNIFLNEPTNRHHDSVKRSQISLSGFSDIFAADIYYHNSCYIQFVNKPVNRPTEQDPADLLKTDVLSFFEYKLRTKVVRDKEAYLLHELLLDVTEWSKDKVSINLLFDIPAD